MRSCLSCPASDILLKISRCFFAVHHLVIMKEGHKVVSKRIEVVSEETLYFMLPEEFGRK